MVADALWLVPLTDFEPKGNQDPVELEEQEGPESAGNRTCWRTVASIRRGDLCGELDTLHGEPTYSGTVLRVPS